MKKRPGSGAKSPPKAGVTAKRVKLLTGGNPQIAKADGNPPVEASIVAMPAGSVTSGDCPLILLHETPRNSVSHSY